MSTLTGVFSEDMIEETAEQISDLLENRRYAAVRDLMISMNHADIAQILEELDEHQIPIAFRLLSKDTASEVFVDLDSEEQELLIRAFSDTELREVFDELYVDDMVDIVEEMPANVVRRVLHNAPSDRRRTINQILNYPEDSAGSIMTTEYVDLKETMTVDDAFTRIRRTGVDKETIYTCYVVDENRKLIGIVTAKTMMLSEQTELIGSIMETNVISVGTHEDQEVVAAQFDKYDFLALPVVDGENRLVGIITIDDVIEVLKEEATEDIEKMAAIVPTDKPYLKMSVLEIFMKRIPWLLLLMVSATFTGIIITNFEDALAAQVALTAFIPMLMDTGGNTGSQASVTVIRALSLGELKLADLPRVIWKEIRIATLCGAALAVVCFAKIMLVDNLILGSEIAALVALVVCLTLFATVLVAKLVGCTLPLLAKAIGFDPAVMASPFITTIVDALSLVVYFNIASALLKL